jgi:hypothetical protein
MKIRAPVCVFFFCFLFYLNEILKCTAANRLKFVAVELKSLESCRGSMRTNATRELSHREITRKRLGIIEGTICRDYSE